MNFDDLYKKNIGNNIREIRKDQKFSQKKMAEEIGISLSQYVRMETGVANTSIGTIIKIAKILNTGIDLLVYGKPVQTDQPVIELTEPTLIEKMKEIEKLNPSDIKLANQVLDMIIAKKDLDNLVKKIQFKGRTNN